MKKHLGVLWSLFFCQEPKSEGVSINQVLQHFRAWNYLCSVEGLLTELYKKTLKKMYKPLKCSGWVTDLHSSLPDTLS